MVTYLLLRNNKESGPLRFEELLQKGLKPYDLIWVNGKSAAWRYPSEIPELIPYAPAIEEQPAAPLPKDDENHVQQDVNTPVHHQPQEDKPAPYNASTTNRPAETRVNQAVQKHAPVTGSHIFVSLPHNEQKAGRTASQPVETPVERQPNFVPPVNTPQPATQNQFAKYDGSRNDPPVELEEKFSQPLDEIKEMYVQTLQQRKKKIAKKNRLQQGLKIAAVILVILSMGMLIGMYYDGDDNAEQVTNSEPITPTDTNRDEFAATQFISSEPVTVLDDEPVANRTTQSEAYRESPSEKKSSVNKPVPGRNDAGNTETYAYTGSVTDSQTKERKRVTREDTNTAVAGSKAGSKTSIENIWNDVSVTKSDFKTGPFGGVRDLQLTIANNSSFPIEKLEVEVKYIGMEKQVVRTQKMVFNDIGPGGQLKADVPRSGRGIDVDVSIQKINVKDFSFARSGK